VENDEGLDAYRRVLGDGFGEGPKEADWVASIYASIGLGSDVPWRHYIAIHEGEPVCTASLFLTPGVAGIYFVSTRPAFRRRGFGTAMTRHVMVEAAGLGAAGGILGSSPMGQGGYQL